MLENYELLTRPQRPHTLIRTLLLSDLFKETGNNFWDSLLLQAYQDPDEKGTCWDIPFFIRAQNMTSGASPVSVFSLIEIAWDFVTNNLRWVQAHVDLSFRNPVLSRCLGLITFFQ